MERFEACADRVVAGLMARGQVATARNCLSTARSVGRFMAERRLRAGGNLAERRLRAGESILAERRLRAGGGSADAFGLEDIDGDFFAAYRDWLVAEGVAGSTVSFYLRTLRLLLKHAGVDVNPGVAPPGVPGVNVALVSKPAVRSGGLDRETLRRIFRADLSDNRRLEVARDIFEFSFYMQGMELTDILALTGDNIRQGGYLVFRRRHKGVEVCLRMEARARAIAERYCSEGGGLLFPIVATRRTADYKNARNKIGIYLRRVGERVGCGELSFSMSRASWQALMRGSGVAERMLD